MRVTPLGREFVERARLRDTLGRVVTIEQACRRMGVNAQEFLAAVNQRRDVLSNRQADLPMVPLQTLTSTFPRSSSIDTREGVGS